MVGEAAKRRKTEFEGRKSAVEALCHSLQIALSVVEAFRRQDDKYTHLLEDDIEKVGNLIEEKKAWMDKSCAALERVDKTTNPSILLCDFRKEKESFESFSRPILTKPKPKAEPPPPPPKEASVEKATNPTGETEKNKSDVDNKNVTTKNGPVHLNNCQDMELD